VTRLSLAGATQGSFAVGKGPFGVTSDGENIWVTNYFGKSLSKLQAKDGLSLGIFKAGDGAAGILYDGAHLWVVNNGDSTVMRIGPDGSIISTYATGKGPFGIAFDGAKIWVSNFAGNSISTASVR
jgi:DNA-binding beta-propeller fold protein YncE